MLLYKENKNYNSSQDKIDLKGTSIKIHLASLSVLRAIYSICIFKTMINSKIYYLACKSTKVQKNVWKNVERIILEAFHIFSHILFRLLQINLAITRKRHLFGAFSLLTDGVVSVILKHQSGICYQRPLLRSLRNFRFVLSDFLTIDGQHFTLSFHAHCIQMLLSYSINENHL